MAAWPWSCRSFTAVHATSPRSWPICSGGSAPIGCSSPAITPSGIRAGSWTSSWPSNSQTISGRSSASPSPWTSRRRSWARTRPGSMASTSPGRRRSSPTMRLPGGCKAGADRGRRMRQEEVYGQLAKVSDPELDQPLTELGFIGGVSIDGNAVTVRFRLPTFWCAPNFAFMMAADIRERVSELPWVERVEVQLQDHFFGPEINDGVNCGKSFVEAFPQLATDDLRELRETFRVKAFLARQERLLRSLLQMGWPEEAILRVRVGDLLALPRSGAGPAPAERYLAILEERGL